MQTADIAAVEGFGCYPKHVERLTNGAIRSQGIGVPNTTEQVRSANSRRSIREQHNKKRNQSQDVTSYEGESAKPRRG